jgi:exodeoxyribonuclease V beta subunit
MDEVLENSRTLSKNFNVLDRDLKIHRNYLIEASAGTGKTFAIENLVVRLLVEEQQEEEGEGPLQLSEILAVTFTRAAARDLKNRIRSKIEEALEAVNSFCHTGEASTKMPGYLFSLIENKLEEAKKIQKRLTQALFCFDEAPIFTIHSFCQRILQDNLFETGMSLNTSGESISTEKLLPVIQDFFRTEIRSEIYSREQFRKVAKNHEDLQSLKFKLLKEIGSGVDLAPQPGFKEQVDLFRKILSSLRQQGFNEASKIEADFTSLVPFYKEICDRQHNIRPEIQKKVLRFAHLFDKEDWDEKDLDLLICEGVCLPEIFDPSNEKAKAKSSVRPQLHYPEFHRILQKELTPFIEEIRNGEGIFMRMAYHCQKHLKNYMEQEELRSFDDLLRHTQEAVKHEAFAAKVSGKYKAAIIDEFQDTDPIQWEIFRTLFFNKGTFLYLVGDPKQSIYSFRQADIYTYLSAAAAMGPGHAGSLSVNYRSHKDLVNALNTLFSAASQFIPLPRLNTCLEYRDVKAGELIELQDFNDGKGRIHFFIASSEKNLSQKHWESLENTYFFPSIIQEIQRLHSKDDIQLKDFAILTADRKQAQRMGEALKKWEIPSINQRGRPLADSSAVTAMRDLLGAVLTPRHESTLKIALGGPILGWTHEEVLKLDRHELLEEVLLKFFDLRSLLVQKGFGLFFQDFMAAIFPLKEQSVNEHLLMRQNGEDLYNDLFQVAELLANEQNQQNSSPEGLIKYLDNLKSSEQTDDEAIKVRSNLDRDGVNILTAHSSKGLEYKIVFALGLAKRTQPPNKQYIDASQSPPVRVPILDVHSKEYTTLCEERDSEKLRLLYVALTRAKQRVYVPALFYPENQKIDAGTASPIDLLLAKLGQTALPGHKALYEKIQTFDKEEFHQVMERLSSKAEITSTYLNSTEFDLKVYESKEPPQLFPPPDYTLPTKQEFMFSYSSLAKKSEYYAHQEAVPPHDYSTASKNKHTLPSGTLLGNVLHGILEHIPLGTSDSAQIEALVIKQTNGTPFSDWQEVLVQMVDCALKAPLPLVLGQTSLSQIDPKKTYRETEFLFSCDQNFLIEGIEHSNGFVKGVIDLLFEHQGKYYILDWKSNWLGPSMESYGQAGLQEAMKAHQYYLQAKIYAEALRLYLNNLGIAPFEEVFGGVLYVFLRGLNPLGTSQHGIYHFFPGRM